MMVRAGFAIEGDGEVAEQEFFMKLITCQECGEKFSAKERQCANCGDLGTVAVYQEFRRERVLLRNQKLGRFVSIVLSLIFLMLAVGFLFEENFGFAGICLFLVLALNFI